MLTACKTTRGNLALFGGSKKHYIGLDIGSDSVKAALVEVSTKKSTIHKFVIEKIPNNPLAEGEVIQPEALEPVIASVIKKLKLGKRKINVGLVGSAVMVKKVSIPKVDDNMLSDQVRWEAEQYIPFDLGSVNLDYVTLEAQSSGDAETIDILIVAAQKNHLRKVVSAVEASGYKVGNVDVSGFAVANIFNYNYGDIHDQAVALLDIGAFFTHFVVVHRGEVIFCRDLPVGGSFFTQEIQTAAEISYFEAERFKVGPEGSMPDVAAQAIENALDSVCDQIQGSFEFFLNTTQGISLSHVFLTGGAAKTKGLAQALGRVLELPTDFLDPRRVLDIRPDALEDDEDEVALKGSVALGLSLRLEGDADDQG